LVTAIPSLERTGWVLAFASFTQSTHWIPTGATRWHSGQVGRPQR
jgi:hypothetical protein